MHGDKLVSGSYDCTVRIWDGAADWACERTLSFGNGVWSLQMSGALLFAGLTIGSIVVTKSTEEGEWETARTLRATEHPELCVVYSMALGGGRLVSGHQQSIKIWE